MSSDDEAKEEVICAVCSRFEPQAWRKKFCKNCFHSLAEHSIDDEKETGHEKLENEKNKMKTSEKDNGDSSTKIPNDKLTKDDQNKLNKPSLDKDKSSPKQTEKTSALADKITKKLSGSKGTDDTTDSLKSKFDTNKNNTEKQNNKTETQKSVKTDDTQNQESDKSKDFGTKSKFGSKFGETINKSKAAKEIDKNASKEKEKKTDLKDDKQTAEPEKRKSWGSKFDSKPPDTEKDISNDISHKDPDKNIGSKNFKVPDKQDGKLKWKDMWGTVPGKKREKEEDNSKKEEKTTDDGKMKKDDIKAKFESKDTGKLWGVSKPEAKGVGKAKESKTSKEEENLTTSSKELRTDDKTKSYETDVPSESDKSKFGDKINLKDAGKSKFDDKSKVVEPATPSGVKFGDKSALSETEKLKFGEKLVSKESEKNKLCDTILKDTEKSTIKDTEKSKFGEKISTTKDSNKSKFGEQIGNMRDSEKSKFGEKFSRAGDSEKSKYGDKISHKDTEKSKLGDKLTNKDSGKSKFGEKIGSEKDSEKLKIDEKFSIKDAEKSKFGDKFTSNEGEKPKFGDKISRTNESGKLNFDDQSSTKDTEKSKLGDRFTSKEKEKSRFGEKISSAKDNEKTKFGDKKEGDKIDISDKNKKKEEKHNSKVIDRITNKYSEKPVISGKETPKDTEKFANKDTEKHKFGQNVTSRDCEKLDDHPNTVDKSKFDDNISTKDKFKIEDKLKTGEYEKTKTIDKESTGEIGKIHKDESGKIKPDEAKLKKDGDLKESDKLKSEIKDAKKRLENKKEQKLEEKSKIDLLKSKIDSKNKGFGVELKKATGGKSNKPSKDETDNKKNEKLENKLKLDIKKAENLSKTDRSVSHSLADRMKDKYEQISKTPTMEKPSKAVDQKTYARSKSDGAIIDEKPKKLINVTSPKIERDDLSLDKVKNESAADVIKYDKKSDLLETKAKSPHDETTHDQVEKNSDIGTDVKDAETAQSEETLPKLNTYDINKIKEAAKSLLIDDDFDDVRYNSLGRRNSGNKSTPSQQATDSLSTSDGIPSTEEDKENEFAVQGTTIISNSTLGKGGYDVDSAFNEKFNSEAEKLKKQLKQMEDRCSELEEENKNLKNGLLENEKYSGRLMKQKQDVENSIKVLQKSLTSIESKCSKLEAENTDLVERIKFAQSKCNGNTEGSTMEELNHLRERLKQGELIVEELREDNENLKQEILDLKGEMEEMYDTFRDQEAEEFRDVQREMEMHAKNCRVLSFKLRKYERLNDQLEAEKENCEEKLRMLQNQISDGDVRSHIRDIEDELRLAKEVSVRLHDELDILEEKKCKCEDENQQLTQILEQSDKKQFRLEMEVDKLRDQVSEYKKKMAEKSTPGTPVGQDDIKDRRF